MKLGTPGQTDGVWTRMGNIRDEGAGGIVAVAPVLQEGFLMNTPTVKRIRFIAAMSMDFGADTDMLIAPDDRVTRIRYLNPTDAMGFGLTADVKTNHLLRAAAGVGFNQITTLKQIRALAASMGYGFSESAALSHSAFISHEDYGYSMSASVVRKRLLSATFALGEGENASTVRRTRSLPATSFAEGFSEAATVTLGGTSTLHISLTNTNVTPSAVNTSFTFSSSGALESHLYDGDTTTDAADPAGTSASTHAAYDFGSAANIREVLLTTGHANGFDFNTVFDIQFSDTSLTSGFTSVGATITAAAGTDNAASVVFPASSHRYWQIIYKSGTTGGNAWLSELQFQQNKGPNVGYSMAAALSVAGVLAPSAVNTTFTFTGSGAAEANLHDGSLTTNAADPAGLTSSTHAAYDLGSAKTVTGMNITTGSANGWSSASTFKIQFSDTSLTSGFSDVTGGSFTIQAGLSKTTSVTGISAGSHRYWRIVYVSGTTGGNAWLAELDFLG